MKMIKPIALYALVLLCVSFYTYSLYQHKGYLQTTLTEVRRENEQLQDSISKIVESNEVNKEISFTVQTEIDKINTQKQSLIKEVNNVKVEYVYIEKDDCISPVRAVSDVSKQLLNSRIQDRIRSDASE